MSEFKKRCVRLATPIGILLSSGALLVAQQMPDRGFRPMLEDRAYATGTGPVVCFDEGHANAHTLAEGFWPFADLVRRDGYVVRAAKLDRDSLTECRIVVIVAPRTRVAGSGEMRKWVSRGGSLLLIADREALTAASGVAAAFDVELTDAVAKPGRFRLVDQTLRPHGVARGRHAKESAANVTTFDSIGLKISPTAEPVLVGADGVVHGAVMRVETGRAAFFGDPTLFTAQIVGPDRRLQGMSAPGAEQNFRFGLHVMHWLSGVI